MELRLLTLAAVLAGAITFNSAQAGRRVADKDFQQVKDLPGYSHKQYSKAGETAENASARAKSTAGAQSKSATVEGTQWQVTSENSCYRYCNGGYTWYWTPTYFYYTYFQPVYNYVYYWWPRTYYYTYYTNYCYNPYPYYYVS